MTLSGTVYLVGAGPGDPELMTVRGLRLLRSADVVVYDRLAGAELLREVADHAERVYVGKAAGFAAMTQRSIESVLIDRARRGQTVVRLKGGDPFVFGRGGEEVEALDAAGIHWEIVPGISSALAAPALAGIPVTHRGLASSITVVTGHEDPTKGETAVDWNRLARCPGTLVVLMGLGQIEGICAQLMAGGMARDLPAAAIASASLPDQRVVVASITSLARAVCTARLRSPVVIVIGEVAAFPTSLDAFSEVARAM